MNLVIFECVFHKNGLKNRSDLDTWLLINFPIAVGFPTDSLPDLC